MLGRHRERHVSHRTGWLRAAVLGANDGIVSTASIIVGVAAAGSSRTAVVTAGVAGLVAGAASMAAGEYVSVSSQADAEQADLAVEEAELRADPAGASERSLPLSTAVAASPPGWPPRWPRRSAKATTCSRLTRGTSSA